MLNQKKILYTIYTVLFSLLKHTKYTSFPLELVYNSDKLLLIIQNSFRLIYDPTVRDLNCANARVVNASASF